MKLVLWRHWCMKLRCIHWPERNNFTAPGCTLSILPGYLLKSLLYSRNGKKMGATYHAEMGGFSSTIQPIHVHVMAKILSSDKEVKKSYREPSETENRYGRSTCWWVQTTHTSGYSHIIHTSTDSELFTQANNQTHTDAATEREERTVELAQRAYCVTSRAESSIRLAHKEKAREHRSTRVTDHANRGMADKREAIMLWCFPLLHTAFT